MAHHVPLHFWQRAVRLSVHPPCPRFFLTESECTEEMAPGFVGTPPTEQVEGKVGKIKSSYSSDTTDMHVSLKHYFSWTEQQSMLYVHIPAFRLFLEATSCVFRSSRPHPNQLEYFPWLSELIMFTVQTRAFSAGFVESALHLLEVCSWGLLSDPVNPPTVTFLRPYIHIYEAILGRAVVSRMNYATFYCCVRINGQLLQDPDSLYAHKLKIPFILNSTVGCNKLLVPMGSFVIGGQAPVACSRCLSAFSLGALIGSEVGHWCRRA